MQGRSWMAALALVAGVTLAAYADDPKARASDDSGVANQVYLEVVVNGFERLGSEVEVEIKPGHAGCDFKPLKLKGRVDGAGRLILVEKQIAARSTRVDRDCSFSITIKEPGEPAKTSNRAVRLDKPKTAADIPIKYLQFMLQSPTLAAREDATRRVRR